MKNKVIIYTLLAIMSMAIACSNEEAMIDNSIVDKSNSENNNNKPVTLSGATMDGVSVLIFGRNDTGFKYQRSISTGWSADGKVSTLLEIGTYKFLFLKYTAANTTFYPALSGSNISFESIRIDAKEDTGNNGYLLPVDELWLPETEAMASATYLIDNPTTIHNKLTRAVSQVKLNIKRAYTNGQTYTPLPFENNKNIMEDIKEIKMDISGVGESISISGGAGNSKTLYSTQNATQITDDGFAVIDGPLVFPNGSGANTSVDITITPKDNSPFPVMATKVEGLLERNKKLEITLWLTSTYKFINVTVKTEPISLSEDEDKGIWE